MTNIIYQAVDEEAMLREGLEPTPQPWEDGLRTDGGAGTFEWWYFDAHCHVSGSALYELMLLR
jgi:hypothetical protein